LDKNGLLLNVHDLRTKRREAMAVHRPSAESNLTLVRRIEAAKRPQQKRFSAAGRTGEHTALPSSQLHVQAAPDPVALDSPSQLLSLEKRGGHRTSGQSAASARVGERRADFEGAGIILSFKVHKGFEQWWY